MKPSKTDDLKTMADQNQQCPCQSGTSNPKAYSQCCQPLHSKVNRATSPEQLMRSRYSAFCVTNSQYLNHTHHPSKRTTDETKTFASDTTNTQWHGLSIINTEDGKDENEGYVEFIARYSENSQPGLLHEKSRFVKDDKQWLYIDGEIIKSGPIPLPSRNEPCWCGSEKKYKKCHG